MCVVLDVNVFSDCFDSSSKNHNNFKPVLNWVVKGNGKLVYGGKKYKKELMAVTKYLRFLAGLQRAGKIVQISDTEVNKYEAEAKLIEPNKKFDDPHLVAIVMASNCRIICTNDKRAIPYLKKSDFYQGKVKKPKIYQTKRNDTLLTDKNIADICLPCGKLTKTQIARLEKP